MVNKTKKRYTKNMYKGGIRLAPKLSTDPENDNDIINFVMGSMVNQSAQITYLGKGVSAIVFKVEFKTPIVLLFNSKTRKCDIESNVLVLKMSLVTNELVNTTVYNLTNSEPHQQLTTVEKHKTESDIQQELYEKTQQQGHNLCPGILASTIITRKNFSLFVADLNDKNTLNERTLSIFSNIAGVDGAPYVGMVFMQCANITFETYSKEKLLSSENEQHQLLFDFNRVSSKDYTKCLSVVALCFLQVLRLLEQQMMPLDLKDDAIMIPDNVSFNNLPLLIDFGKTINFHEIITKARQRQSDGERQSNEFNINTNFATYIKEPEATINKALEKLSSDLRLTSEFDNDKNEILTRLKYIAGFEHILDKTSRLPQCTWLLYILGVPLINTTRQDISFDFSSIIPNSHGGKILIMCSSYYQMFKKQNRVKKPKQSIMQEQSTARETLEETMMAEMHKVVRKRISVGQSDFSSLNQKKPKTTMNAVDKVDKVDKVDEDDKVDKVDEVDEDDEDDEYKLPPPPPPKRPQPRQKQPQPRQPSKTPSRQQLNALPSNVLTRQPSKALPSILLSGTPPNDNTSGIKPNDYNPNERTWSEWRKTLSLPVIFPPIWKALSQKALSRKALYQEALNGGSKNTTSKRRQPVR